MDIYTLALSIAYSNRIGKQIKDQAFKTQIELNRDILNTIGEEKIFYFLPKEDGKPQNGYDEYIFFNNNWELMGSTEIDLSNYYTKEEVNQLIPLKTSQLTNDSHYGRVFYKTVGPSNTWVEKNETVSIQVGQDCIGINVGDILIATIDRSSGSSINKKSRIFVVQDVPAGSNYYYDAMTITPVIASVYTKTEIDNAISNIETLHFEIVQQRPQKDIKTNTIYLIPSNKSENENIYEEWIYANNNWELIGSTNIDLSSYITNIEATQKINENKIKSAMVNQDGTITFTLNDNSTITTYGYGVIGKQGEPGQDYTLTNQDKDDIADLVLEKIPDADVMNF